jgi:hypothetical protein
MLTQLYTAGAYHNIQGYQPGFNYNDYTINHHRLFMSLLYLAKRALTRPISSSAFIAVGIAFVLLLHKTYSDRSVQQPVTTRNMHIQSIPMCECLLCST